MPLLITGRPVDSERHSNATRERTKTAIIIGAGPAGLTAAYELLSKTDIKPIVLERSESMGGLSRTVNFNGNRMDIGGHRFFSKSDRVMNWWLREMPIESTTDGPVEIRYHGMARNVTALSDGTSAARSASDSGMLIRKRKSRVYFLRKFFDYPINLTLDTLWKLGIVRTLRIGLSYIRSALFPKKDVGNLEEFFINRFGRELYRTFFKSYTEKVWGVPCTEISAAWGEQRIKGLSIRKSILHVLKRVFLKPSDIAQRGTETSLIEQFLYPKLGPGQMWESVARRVRDLGGEIVINCEVSQIHFEEGKVTSVTGVDPHGRERRFSGDYFFSTMAVKDLISSMGAGVPKPVKEVSQGLLYRDFIAVGLLVKELKVKDKNGKLIEDNWIYVQEPEVLAGRLQIFNNWSPYLVANPDNAWIGVEYFCYEADALWKKTDAEMGAFAAEELERIGILERKNVVDSTVVRMTKTYPAYFGTYNRFHEIRQFVDGFENLYLIGRNGMHRYHNQDHSMLTAMLAVENILSGRKDKNNLWEVNTEMEYHETKNALEINSAQAAVRNTTLPKL
jgi:protoporphyrinogen oxidase